MTVSRSSGPRVVLARIYDQPADDRYRVLVDGLWPRGISRDHAPIDQWCPQVAPSTALRTWYQHEPARFTEFSHRYKEELEQPERAAAFDALRQLVRAQPVTIVTATKAAQISHACVLVDLLNADQPA